MSFAWVDWAFERTAMDTSSRVSILQCSGAGEKSEGQIIIKPAGSERETFLRY